MCSTLGDRLRLPEWSESDSLWDRENQIDSQSKTARTAITAVSQLNVGVQKAFVCSVKGPDLVPDLLRRETVMHKNPHGAAV